MEIRLALCTQGWQLSVIFELRSHFYSYRRAVSFIFLCKFNAAFFNYTEMSCSKITSSHVELINYKHLIVQIYDIK